jgi:hypothetical protein
VNANTAASFKPQANTTDASFKLQAHTTAASFKLQAASEYKYSCKQQAKYKYSRKAKDESLKQIQRQGTRLGGGSVNMLTPFHFDILHFTFNIQHSIFPLSPFQL